MSNEIRFVRVGDRPMIKRKIIEIENVGIRVDEEWRRIDASVVLEDSDPVELEITIGSTAILLSVQDLLDCMEEFEIDIASWIE